MELNNLIIENQNMIYKITHYFEKYASKEDLFQVGCVGLIKAYKKYDESYGAKFTTYAYPYILGEIRKYVREDKGLKISREISKLNLKIEKATILLTQKLMREPSVQEISNYLEIPEYYVVESLKSLSIIESIDRPINDDSSKEITLKDTISSKKENIDELIMLRDEINNLSPLERELLEKRYSEDCTQNETAKILGMSQVQVSRSENKILNKLKTKLTV